MTKKSKEIIKENLNWKDYGRSVMNLFLQNFIKHIYFPENSNIDKRKAHLSNLICSKQITRTETKDI